MTIETHSNPRGKVIAARITGERLPDETRAARCDRVLLVGEANPYGDALENALYPAPEYSAGGRLREILDLTPAEQRSTWRANLCVGEWRDKPAISRVDDLFAATISGRAPWTTIVLLGAKVRRAARCGAHVTLLPEDAIMNAAAPVSSVRRDVATCYFDTKTDKLEHKRALTIICLPHPSGRCHLWNLPGVTEEARETYARMA